MNLKSVINNIWIGAFLLAFSSIFIGDYGRDPLVDLMVTTTLCTGAFLAIIFPSSILGLIIIERIINKKKIFLSNKKKS